MINVHKLTERVIVVDDQQDANILIYLFIPNHLHVSGDVLVHHQEHSIVFTASGIVDRFFCRLLSLMRWN